LQERERPTDIGGLWLDSPHFTQIIRNDVMYRNTEIQDVSDRFVSPSTAILLDRIRSVALVGGNEVTNPFVVTKVYIQQSGGLKLGSMSFTKLLGE
jgi:hypothetical protein